MPKHFSKLFVTLAILAAHPAAAQLMDSIVLKDIIWDKEAPAGSVELFIPSGNSMIAGVIYRANGPQKHPTLLLLHGYPGNERNLDLGQVVRAHGWNVVYFDYRGSWGSQGQFTFSNCVEDVKNVLDFCRKYSDSLRIDTANIALFGHSMGGWVCLKALSQLPGIKKGFALSTWDIGGDMKDVRTEEQMMKKVRSSGPEYFVLNNSIRGIFDPVLDHRTFYDLRNDVVALSAKQIVMVDENNLNQEIAAAIKATNKSYFKYEVWVTDHPFTNKRVALIKMVLAFLDR